MMRSSTHRFFVIAVSTVLLAAAGMLAGYVFGRYIVLRQTRVRLEQYATRILMEGATSRAESRKVLASMNASPYPFCSVPEIDYFRELVFGSQYLKAAGRMRNGRIECSTTLGSGDLPATQYQPDFTHADGARVYRNLSPFKIDSQDVITVQLGDSYIVYNPYNLKTLVALPMHYTVTAIDAPSRQARQLLGEQTGMPDSILRTEGTASVGDSLYATRCSPETDTCMTGYIATADAMRIGQPYLAAYILLGGLAGSFLGIFLPLIYSRNKSVEHRLMRAIRRDKLWVVYQPIVDLATGKIVEAEALVRWTDEDIQVSPDVFVKIAESRGFVGALTRMVVRHVLRDFGATMRARTGFRVNVNIAASDLSDVSFIPMLEESIADAEVPTRSLGIEITESYTARHQVAKDTILKLRKRGHCVHIDDFGTGYSSLAYLHDLSVDAIKIDKAFTKAIGTEAVTVSILPQILTMAETLNLQVVVEGIETQAQADYFAAADQGILAQGWLFGRPISARAFLQLLDDDETETGTGLRAPATHVMREPVGVA
jgi:sensor c-di-GMP phosphodiesterase-like protein